MWAFWGGSGVQVGWVAFAFVAMIRGVLGVFALCGMF